jgi:myo-inositol-1(or 4)-monophosphatase
MSYTKELTFAKGLALEAGKIMRRYFRAEDIGTEWKEDNTPLTAADTAVNDMVIKKVKQAFPDRAVIGEEASHDQDGELAWVVDPIDGTVPFSLGIPISTFSLALVDRKDGQPLVGVIYDPYLDHMYTAVRDDGAFLNDTRLSVSKATTFPRNYVSIIGGSGKGGKTKYNRGQCFDIIHAQDAKCMSIQTQAYFAAKVATGELVGSIFGYGAPWDVAAACLLVEEAGGVVTDLSGEKRRYDEFADGCVLAANQTILSKLLEAIQKSVL